MNDLEVKIKHLEMIQSVVTRLSGNSFLLKGWAITLAVGILAFVGSVGNRYYMAVAYVPIVVFWILDSYYLQTERKYRKLYRKVADKEGFDPMFTMKKPAATSEDKTLLVQSLFSKTEILLYGALAILVTVFVVIYC